VQIKPIIVQIISHKLSCKDARITLCVNCLFPIQLNSDVPAYQTVHGQTNFRDQSSHRLVKSRTSKVADSEFWQIAFRLHIFL